MTTRIVSGKYGFSYITDALKYKPEQPALNPVLPPAGVLESAEAQMTWQWLIYIWL